MKDSQRIGQMEHDKVKYIKVNNERFSTVAQNMPRGE